MSQNKTAVALLPENAAVQSEQIQPDYTTLLPITLRATPAQQECARIITQGRQRGKHLAAPSASIGTAEADFKATYYGTLAELVIADWLERLGHRPQYTLLAPGSVTSADFLLDGKRIEIKCSPPGKHYLSISIRQHSNPKRKADFYLFALCEDEETLRIVPPVSYDQVSTWTRMDNRHEPYYSCHRDDLTPSPTAAFFRSLFKGYEHDERLCLEIRPSHPLWREAELYPNGNAPQGWQFHTGKARRWFSLSQLLEATKHALSIVERGNVFFGVLPRIGESGKGADVPLAGCLWCDVDGGTEGVEGAKSLLEVALRSGKLPPPHVQIVSGNGLHLYWNLSEPVPLDTDEARQRFKALLQRLCKVIGGNSEGAHADLARCDVASILRVPGTLNHKQKDNPKYVEIMSVSDTETRSRTWWSANLPPLPLSPAPRQERPPLALGETRTLPPKALDLLQTRHPEGTKHNALRELLYIARAFCGFDAFALELLAQTMTSHNSPWQESHWRGMVKDTLCRVAPAGN